MKKLKFMLTTIVSSIMASNLVFAASVPANSFNNLNDGSLTVNTQSGNNTGYIISDKFVCYGCLSEVATGYAGVSDTSSGIGIYFKNSDKWETGSFAGSISNDPFPSYAMSSFFVAMTTGSKDYSDAIENGFLTASSGKLTKNYSNATVTVTAEPLKNKNYVKLIYDVESSVDQTVKIATFNDIYLGEPSSDTDKIEACKDNASYEANTHISNITNGFNAKTSGKFMSVVLEENSGLLDNGGGSFKYWVGTYTQKDDSLPSPVVVNMFNTSSLASSTSFDDSAFSYSWSKAMSAGEKTTFSTLIGLGNNNPVEIKIDESKISPNYDKSNKTFTLTEKDSNINIGGTIKDECGMGTCTYTINGKGPYDCDDKTYYTDSSFETNFSTTIGVKNLKSKDNEFVVTANSVACGISTDKTTFDLTGDAVKNPQTGINNNYIILGLILVSGIGVYMYSRKHNKFPQV